MSYSANGNGLSAADVAAVMGNNGGNGNGGRSMHSIKDRSIDALERMIDSAQTEHERQKISKYIEMIEKTDNT